MLQIFEVRYQTVSDWIDAWDDYGLRGLYKKHEGGKPPIYTDQEAQRIKRDCLRGTSQAGLCSNKDCRGNREDCLKTNFVETFKKSWDLFISGFVRLAVISATRSSSGVASLP